MKWLIDTNVISETRKPQASDAVRDWITSLSPSEFFTTEMNLAELVYGAGKASDVLMQRDIMHWIDNVVRLWFVGRIIAIDEKALVRWRILTREMNVKKLPAPSFDLLIAATAQQSGLAIATRDVAPFVACGLPTLNPFTSERFNGA